MPSWQRYGQAGFYLDLGIAGAADRALRTQAAAARLRARLPGADVVVGGGVVACFGVGPSPEVEDALREALQATGAEAPAGRLHVIQAAYDGPDLEDAARALGMTPEELVARHAGTEVLVELVGFLPGFAYLGPIDPRLVLPRRPSPRPSVPAGSIALAGTFTGIYPFTSPGGWNLIGRAVGFSPFDPARAPAIAFAPGDRVRFSPIEGEAPRAEVAVRSPAVPEAPGCALVILTASAVATVQDGGRQGMLAQGLPPSGPLDPEAMAAANRAVGNAPGAAAIEIPMGSLLVRARGEVCVSVDGEAPVRLEHEEEFRVQSAARAVRYLAVAGGIAVPEVLGARATLLVARMGGFAGRPLKKGDVVPVGAVTGAGTDAGAEAEAEAVTDAEAIVRIDPGPHVDRFPAAALPTLLGTTFQVSQLLDRVGTRLEGGKIPREGPDLALPVPMVRGAVQVTTDGTPIVLGPDHPTTGGYPVLAVVRRESWGTLARRRPGEMVRFEMGA